MSEKKFIKNSHEARVALAKNGFEPLSFCQGKEYIQPMISTFANCHTTWKEKSYSTFSKSEMENMPYLGEECAELSDFINFIENMS